ncbi:MAG TPA: DUF721 domain-containing protein [Micropepsaceae bacterium]|jgi:hypothetical protein|nr:DUF721 domain-containing protein [Micropepsaceae bacterium]
MGRTKPAAETALGEAKTAFVRAGFTDMTFLLRWPEIAGAQIARITRPAKWQDGPEGATLTLRCEAGAIVFLQHQTRELTDRLNAYLGRGRISRLKLVPGRLEQMPEPPAHPAPMACVPTGKPELSHALGRLGEARSRLKTARHARPAKPPD